MLVSPNPPRAGEPIRAQWMSDFIQWIKDAVMPRGDGKTIRVEGNIISAVLQEPEIDHPFKQWVVKDGNGKEQIAVSPGVIEVQGASPVFSLVAYNEPCHPFDFSLADDGYYYIVAYAKYASDKVNHEFGVLVLSLGGGIEEFSFPNIGGNSFHVIGIVKKASYGETYILSVNEQNITGKIIVSDIDSELPFTAGVHISIGDVSALKTASSFAISSVWIRPGYIYNEDAKTSTELNDANSFVPSIGWNCAMLQQNLEQGAPIPFAILWSAGDWSSILPYEVDIEGKIIRKNILLARLYIPADYSLEFAELYNYNPVNFLNSQGDTYKVKVNGDDDQPDYISVKIAGDNSSSDYTLIANRYIQVSVYQDTATPENPNPPYKLKLSWDYKNIPNYPGGEAPKPCVIINDVTNGVTWDRYGKVAVSSVDNAIQFLEDKLTGQAATTEYDNGYIGFFKKEVGTGTGILVLKAQWQYMTITGYNAAVQYAMTIDPASGKPAWADVVGKVKSVASGPLGYLMDRLSQNTELSGEIIIITQSANGDPFFDVAWEHIPGFDITKQQLLHHAKNGANNAEWGEFGFLSKDDVEAGASIWVTDNPSETQPNKIYLCVWNGLIESSEESIKIDKTNDLINPQGIVKFDLNVDWTKVEVAASISDMITLDTSRSGKLIIKAASGAGLYYHDGTKMTKIELSDGVLTCVDGVLSFEEVVDCPNSLE